VQVNEVKHHHLMRTLPSELTGRRLSICVCVEARAVHGSVWYNDQTSHNTTHWALVILNEYWSRKSLTIMRKEGMTCGPFVSRSRSISVECGCPCLCFIGVSILMPTLLRSISKNMMPSNACTITNIEFLLFMLVIHACDLHSSSQPMLLP